ncbi:Uncharacterized protein FKW44_024400 [Caligus rogercresseyi]|uniref:Reverse transcriptase domain-containing protein n=1 Tax=Caligus rogercresseyi TaxID=217165 RepID=A0A7T8JT37_CALRO|nr:Uncharacterized protein FKW44_024830 [Caligus rogercresseyi]QQP33128.1 Uncharacterized protein FKW44_024400 [Caligus rogercresseyi]
MKNASLDNATTKATWKSYGKFECEHRTPCFDHVYSAGLDCSVKVVEDATSDLLTTAALATAHAEQNRGERLSESSGLTSLLPLTPSTSCSFYQSWGSLGLLAYSLSSYITSGYQRVVWNGTESEFLPVEYGVRQGSILGPIIYLVLVADVTSCTGVGNEDNSGYAEDFFLWAVGESGPFWSQGQTPSPDLLGGTGLILNATKTQLMIGDNVKKKDVAVFTMNVGGVKVHQSDEIEFLGVKFDTGFTTAPHNINVAKAAAQRAALISRLAVPFTKRKYLWQLVKGLMIGKIIYAAAAVTIPRLDNECKGPNAAHRAMQVAIMTPPGA